MQYAERDIIEQGEHHATHIDAMTAEGLHSKSAIAAELAHRDIEIERLRKAGIEVIGAFERLGNADNVRFLIERANCENAMLKLKRILTPDSEGNVRPNGANS